jgi:hypothetical protein
VFRSATQELASQRRAAQVCCEFGALAEFFGLIPSGGSDWHGGADPARVIGCMHIPGAWLVRQDEAVAKRLKEVA